MAIILALVGIIGAIVPALPGPIISWVGLLLAYFTEQHDLSLSLIIIMGVVAGIITILDNIVPIWGTRKMGGTKGGVRGSTIGLIVSVFILPILGITIGPFGLVSILLGPFIGAYLGEKMANNDKNAFRSACGSFIGFLVGTLMKLIYTIIATVYVFIGIL